MSDTNGEGMVSEVLTPAQISTKSRELADLCQEIDQMRAAAAADASGMRKKIRAKENERRLLADEVRTGTKMVSAQEAFGFAGGRKKRQRSESPE